MVTSSPTRGTVTSAPASLGVTRGHEATTPALTRTAAPGIVGRDQELTLCLDPGRRRALRALPAALSALAIACGDSPSAPEDRDTAAVDVGLLQDASGPEALSDITDLAPLPDADDADTAELPTVPPDTCEILEDCPPGWACVDLLPGPDNGFCARSCTSDAQCVGDDCVIIRGDDVAFGACLPPDLCIDADEDGYGTGPGCAGGDCDEANVAVNGGAEEQCNGSDDNCDGLVDNNTVESGDDCATGFAGVCAEGRLSCERGIAVCVQRYAIETETCDGRDNDCDGDADEDAADMTIWHTDADGDRFGSATTIAACTAPDGFVADGGDCDDTRRDIYPFAFDACDGVDNDCDGDTDEDAADVVLWYPDADDDRFGRDTGAIADCAAPDGYVADAGDCDDLDPLIHPTAIDVCDLHDNDCDGTTDEDAVGVRTWFEDDDRDGHGVATRTVTSCASPEGYAATGDDCRDDLVAVHPGAAETCDGLDNDCNGTVDDTVEGARLWYRDFDGDGWGAGADFELSCAPLAGRVGRPGDCDDLAFGVNPDAVERCNGFDDNCAGGADESAAVDARAWYRDLDRDSFGRPGTPLRACLAPDDTYADNDADCDDSSAAAYPGAIEVCNELDDNCNAARDEGVTSTFYRDADSDGAGALAAQTNACAAPAGYVSTNNDCDDANSSRSPSLAETCDEVDNDCDGVVDDGVRTTFYRDGDSDAYGAATVTVAACTMPAGYVRDATDCDDANPSRNPGRPEICDDVDNDCDGTPDDGLVSTFYRDADGDTFGSATVTLQRCLQPAGYVADATDCDDTTALRRPNLTETCDGLDNDCDGVPDDGVGSTWYIDNDGDTWGAASVVACTAPVGGIARGGDCADSNPAVNPGASELCATTYDDNCINGANESSAIDASWWFLDGDEDGQAPETPVRIWPVAARACTRPSDFCPLFCFIERIPYVNNELDCDDSSGRARTGGGPEVIDGYDNDCNGTRDDGLCTPYVQYWEDHDEDGWTDDSILACTRPVDDSASEWRTTERCCDSDDSDSSVP